MLNTLPSNGEMGGVYAFPVEALIHRTLDLGGFSLILAQITTAEQYSAGVGKQLENGQLCRCHQHREGGLLEHLSQG